MGDTEIGAGLSQGEPAPILQRTTPFMQRTQGLRYRPLTTLVRCFEHPASNGRQDLVFALPISFCTGVIGQGTLWSEEVGMKIPTQIHRSGTNPEHNRPRLLRDTI